MGEVVPTGILDSELWKTQSMMLDDIFTRPLPPSIIPLGSNLANVNDFTKASMGTPCCNPIETAMANWDSSALQAAPSLEVSRKISPSFPSSYSPSDESYAVTPYPGLEVRPFFLCGRGLLGGDVILD